MRKEMYTMEDVVKGSMLDYTGKVVVLSEYVLNEKHRNPQNQIVEALGGFGCDPTALGNAVFVTFLIDGEANIRFNRGDILGILKDELLEEFYEDKKEFERLKSEQK